MSKGLEALKSICNKGCDFCDLYYHEHNKYCKEEMKGCENCIFCGEKHDIIEKELEALEIIKEKGVCLPALKLTASFEKDNLEEYNKICLKYYVSPLTNEEYGLLREELL